jgi:hypothetical protein
MFRVFHPEIIIFLQIINKNGSVTISFYNSNIQNGVPIAVILQYGHGDPTAKCAEARLFYFDRMSMIEQAAITADAVLSSYILKAVTEGVSYEHLKAGSEIPCCKDVYYTLYRRFFWLLNKERQ